MQIIYKCDNRKCVNPNHLYIGTHQDNMNDMVERDRQARGEKNGRAKLTYREVKQLRGLHQRGGQFAPAEDGAIAVLRSWLNTECLRLSCSVQGEVSSAPSLLTTRSNRFNSCQKIRKSLIN
jgi:hypothetical protein